MNGYYNKLYISSSAIESDNILISIDILSTFTKNIELSGGTEYSENLLTDILEISKNRNLNLIVHSYFPPPVKDFILNFANTDELTRDFIRESLKYINALKVDVYSIHSGFKRDFEGNGELLFKSSKAKTYTIDDLGNNISWFQNEFPEIKLVLENLYPNNNNLDCGFMMHIDEIDLIMKKFKNIYLLLDLGHLFVSSNLLKFDFLESVDYLLNSYSDRIKEIHLSENKGFIDSHLIIGEKSIQYRIIKKYIKIIKEKNIILTIESRNSPIEKLKKCYYLFNELMTI